jgi:hypothetical protein
MSEYCVQLPFLLAAHDVREGDVKDLFLPHPYFLHSHSYYVDNSRVENRQTVVVDQLHVTVHVVSLLRTSDFEACY